MFSTHPCSFTNIDGPVTYLLYDFLNDVDIELFLEFKKSLVKYHPVCPKNL